jgi:hypothetical protein
MIIVKIETAVEKRQEKEILKIEYIRLKRKKANKRTN